MTGLRVDDSGASVVPFEGMHPGWTAGRLLRLRELADGDAAYLATCPRLTYDGTTGAAGRVVFRSAPGAGRPGVLRGIRPRGVCAECGQDVAVRRDGLAGGHGSYLNRCPGMDRPALPAGQPSAGAP